jgi:hypothetical protein
MHPVQSTGGPGRVDAEEADDDQREGQPVQHELTLVGIPGLSAT